MNFEIVNGVSIFAENLIYAQKLNLLHLSVIPYLKAKCIKKLIHIIHNMNFSEM